MAFKVERRHLLVERLEHLLRHPYDEVVFGAVEPIFSLAMDNHAEFVGACDGHTVPHIERESERVEARAEVCR